MDPSGQFCPNFYCLHRGKRGLGNIRAHSRTEQRYRCATCGKTFAATRNTPYYRLHKPLALVTVVLALLTHGCPIQAIVAAFGLDEALSRLSPPSALRLVNWNLAEFARD